MTETTETPTCGNEVLLYPVFRHLCPDMPEDEFQGMRFVVLGWMFGNFEVPTA